MQLPPPECTDQEVNYSIIIVDNNESSSESMQLYGPYHHVGAGTVKHNIDSGLQKNKEYSAHIVVDISHNVTVTSYSITFSK